MTVWEHQAVFNMTDTSCESLNTNDLDKDIFANVVLDYGDITGSDALKAEIWKLYQKQKADDDITITAGCLNANVHVMDTLLCPGDHVITFKPGYEQFSKYPRSMGCEVTEIETKEEDNWKIDEEKIKKEIKPNTKLIVLASPNNPTGYQIENWEPFIKIAKANNLWILCDEVYGQIGKKAESISDLYEKGISTGSLSKCWGAPAIRLGWVKGNKELIEKINYRRDYTIICVGPLQDKIGTVILKNSESILKRNNETVEQNKEALRQFLKNKKNNNFHCVIPEAGSVAFLRVPWKNSEEMAVRLIREHGLFFVPGECFGMPGYFRLGLGRNGEIFQKGLKLLGDC